MTFHFYRIKNAIINDGKCHHLCFTWLAADGKWSLYKEGKYLKGGKGLSAGKAIQTGGYLSLAQKIPNPTLETRYVGKINDLNIWNKILNSKEIEAMSKCGGSTQGNVKSWSDFKLNEQTKYAKYRRKNICPGNC